VGVYPSIDQTPPLSGRMNIVLSETAEDKDDGVGLGEEEEERHHVCSSFEDALALLSRPDVRDGIEVAFVIGGEGVYREAGHDQSAMWGNPHLPR